MQTRTPETTILGHAKLGSVEPFYTEELELRKNFNYPPFSTFIHLTWQGAPAAVKKIEAFLSSLLKDFHISIYQNPTASPEAPIMYGLIRIPAPAWPDQKLVERIRMVPPSVRVIVNPEKIV